MSKISASEVAHYFPKLSADAIQKIERTGIESIDQLLCYAGESGFWEERLNDLAEKDKEIILKRSFEPDYYGYNHGNLNSIPAIVRFEHTWYPSTWMSNTYPYKQEIVIDRIKRTAIIIAYASDGVKAYKLNINCGMPWIERFFQTCEKMDWNMICRTKMDSDCFEVCIKYGDGKSVKRCGDEPTRVSDDLLRQLEMMLRQIGIRGMDIYLLGLYM